MLDPPKILFLFVCLFWIPALSLGLSACIVPLLPMAVPSFFPLGRRDREEESYRGKERCPQYYSTTTNLCSLQAWTEVLVHGHMCTLPTELPPPCFLQPPLTGILTIETVCFVDYALATCYVLNMLACLLYLNSDGMAHLYPFPLI